VKRILANAKTIVILGEPQGRDPESNFEHSEWIGFRSLEDPERRMIPDHLRCARPNDVLVILAVA
jgi:hypothetical protein